MKDKKTRNEIRKVKDKEDKQGKTEKLFIALLVLLVVIVAAIFVILFSEKQTIKQEAQTTQADKADKGDKGHEIKEDFEDFILQLRGSEENISSNVKAIYVPAVDKDGNGVMTKISVEILPGNGKTLVDINNLLFWADTQESIRKAKEIAQNITGVNLSNYDLIYQITANASVVGGPSAGAAITIATIAAILNKTINPNVTISGTINYDGTIGPISEVLAKAETAKESGMKIMLVPIGQSREVTYEEKKTCRTYGYVEYCEIEKIPKIIDIGQEVGIEVREVKDIFEVVKYFFQASALAKANEVESDEHKIE
jgi:predicted S18 family serine protease/cell division protein FtsL